MQGMKRPRVPLPTEADEEGSGEDADKGANAPEQQTIRASSRIRTPAMKPEDSDFILTHELGRKAPRIAGVHLQVHRVPQTACSEDVQDVNTIVMN